MTVSAQVYNSAWIDPSVLNREGGLVFGRSRAIGFATQANSFAIQAKGSAVQAKESFQHISRVGDPESFCIIDLIGNSQSLV